MDIKFSSLPNNDFTYMGITADIVEAIAVDNIPVGIVYLSEMDKPDEKCVYIEYIEFLSVFRGKHLLRPILAKLSEKYGNLYFECEEDLVKKYFAVGAKQTGCDEDREMYQFIYRTEMRCESHDIC